MSDRRDDERQSRPEPRDSPGSRGRSPAEDSLSRATSTRRLGSPVPSYGLSGSPRLPVPQVPTPQQLQSGEPSESRTPLAGLEAGKSSLPGPGESALANALKGSFGGNSPPRFPSPQLRAASPAPETGSIRGAPRTNYGSFQSGQQQNVGSPGGRLEDHEIVRRHLVGAPGGSSSNLAGGVYGSPKRGGWRDSDNGDRGDEEDDDEEFNSLQLQGGDITRQIYRWTEQQEAEAQGKTRRSRSFHAARPRPNESMLDIDTIKQPGGFRRNYLRRAAPSPSPGPSNGNGGPNPRPQVFTNNFLEFLSLYGHFAGEELEEDDEVLGPDEYFSSDAYDEGTGGESEGEPGEGSALLTPHKKRKRRKERSSGKGSPSGAAMLLLKSFVGTGVLFLPRAFLNGGMLFSNIVLLVVSALSYYCFVLLTTTRLYVHASFGDMGYHLYGKWMRNLINVSLIVSQIGFSSAYIVFVSENLQAFVEAVSKCRTFIDIKYMILMQMIIFLPLSLYRNINHIQKLALVADAFIVLGLVYLYYYDILTLASNHGISDIKNFNPKDWTLFIGTAIFTFEGIGLIIPIQSSMKEPAKFPRVLGMVMIIITVIFVSMGAISYAAFGSKTKTVIILNLPQDNKFVNGVQFIYSLAILLSTPLQIFPAIEIASQQLFSKTGKFNPWVKWKKNIFRFFMVMCCALIAWVGAGDLDKFVSLVGSFACIPLVYIYPPMLHYKAVSRTFWQRFADISLCVIGAVMMVYTTALTINSWVSGDAGKPPGYCDDK